MVVFRGAKIQVTTMRTSEFSEIFQRHGFIASHFDGAFPLDKSPTHLEPTHFFVVNTE